MKSRTALLIAMGLLFLFGLGSVLYPPVNGVLLTQKQSKQIEVFHDIELKEESAVSNPLLEQAMAYNARLISELQCGFCSRSAYEAAAFQLADFGLDSEVFAVLSIPAIEVELPVYLGANAANLALGAAHLGETSLPIGGQSTHCVIAAHRGWKGAAYFRDLPQLQLGDTIYLTNLWDTLEYKVIQRSVIQADDIASLLIQPKQDLLTLLTCCYSPDGQKLRYLVTCQRVL